MKASAAPRTELELLERGSIGEEIEDLGAAPRPSLRDDEHEVEIAQGIDGADEDADEQHGRSIGSSIAVRMRQLPAPSIRAASTTSMGSARSPASRIENMNGRPLPDIGKDKAEQGEPRIVHPQHRGQAQAR